MSNKLIKASLLAAFALMLVIGCDRKSAEKPAPPPVKVTNKKKLPSDPAPAPTPTPTPGPGVVVDMVTPTLTADTATPPAPIKPQPTPTVIKPPTVVQPKPGQPQQPGQPIQPRVIKKPIIHQPGQPQQPGQPIVQQPGPTAPPRDPDFSTGQGPLAPQIINAPNKGKCLQWTVVKKRICRPRTRCVRMGGTCHGIKRCYRVPYDRLVNKQFCWQRPQVEYTKRRVCTPRWIVSNVVRCSAQVVYTTVRQHVCRNMPVVQMVKKRQCTHNPALCTNQRICRNQPTQVCGLVAQRTTVRQCKNVPVRINKPQRVCTNVPVRTTVMQQQCKNLPQSCRNVQNCQNRPTRKCGPVRSTVMKRVCSNVRVPVNKPKQVCQMVNVRKVQRKRVCKPGGPTRCTVALNCRNPHMNRLCARNPRLPQCRRCSRRRVCKQSKPRCTVQNVPVNVRERRCRNVPGRTFVNKQQCRNVPQQVVKQQCRTVTQRKCTPKRVCTPGRRVCANRPVVKMVTKQKCRMITRPQTIMQQRCGNVVKVNQVRKCRMVSKPSCQMVKKCRPGGQRCVDRLIRTTVMQRRCSQQMVRRPIKKRVCRQVPQRRRLTSCRMERRVIKRLVRHCKNVSQRVRSYRTKCDPGVKCTPGREQCRTEKICRVRLDQVCAAW